MDKQEGNAKPRKNRKQKNFKVPELAETAICVLTLLGSTCNLGIDDKGRVSLNDQIITSATHGGVGLFATNSDCGGGPGPSPTPTPKPNRFDFDPIQSEPSQLA